MPELIPVLSKTEIQDKVARIGARISAEYQGRDLVLVGVLNGAFVFLADLARHIDLPVKIDFIRVSSYHAEASSCGKISFTKALELDIQGKDILIVEDIVDTGLTLACLVDHFKTFKPRSIKICALISKKERRETGVEPDYVCFEVEKGFLVGYGLDYAESYRHLPEIFHVEF